MKILIAEDEVISRKFIYKFMSRYGECDLTFDGNEAIEAFEMAMDTDEAYDLICLDIMMPVTDGLQALKRIREIENEKQVPNKKRVKIIMTTALSDIANIQTAFNSGSEGYAVKPIDTTKLEEVMKRLGILH